jgi:DNA-binding NtrC family response regulator
MKTDVRVIAATNVNLQEAVRAGRFREDLYYRLSTVPIYIPPLRERGEDIYLLFRKFATDFSEKNKIPSVKLTDDAKKLVLNYPWPGNVRQLKNVAEQVSILAIDKEVTATELSEIVPDITQTRLPALAEARYESGGSNFTEREILYKLIFDLKKDLNDLKQFVYDITKQQMNGNNSFDQTVSRPQFSVAQPTSSDSNPIVLPQQNNNQPVFINDKSFEEHETIDESLSILDKEKELILKALKKHRNKRKDAATDLGISERTLYRKIKEYDIDI